MTKGRKQSGSILSVLYAQRSQIWALAKNDFRTRYAGSHFGVFWAFVQPVVTVLVYFLSFGVGFRSGQNMSVPFVVYLTCGIVPWFCCQEVLLSGTGVLIDYSYLVKKVVFEIRTLPFIKVVSALFVHAFFVVIAVLIAALYGIAPSVHILSLVYYYFAMTLFLLGLTYGAAAVTVFFRDLRQVISIGLQIGIWSVPIMFDPAQFSWGERFGWIFYINPMAYIVQGYREAIYGRAWPHGHLLYGLYFWAVTALLLFLGGRIFRKMQPHFADVL